MSATTVAYASAGFAFLAAVLWIWSALTWIPPIGAIMSGFRIGSKEDRAVQLQKWLNAGAAATAGVAAGRQGLATFLARPGG